MIRKLFALLLTLCLFPAAVLAEEAAPKAAVFPSFEAENILDAKTPVTEAIFEQADMTLVNCWATWCGPCVGELPDLGTLSELSEGRVQVVSVLLDSLTVSDDGKEMMRDEKAIADALTLMADAKAEYPVLVPEGFLLLLGTQVQVVPTTFLINRAGELVQVVTGARSAQDWLKLAESLMAEAE